MKKKLLGVFDVMPGQVMAFNLPFPFTIMLENHSQDKYKVTMRERSFSFQKIRTPKIKPEPRSPLPDWED